MIDKFINKTNFDFAIKPSDNFNLYCNNNWKKNNKIPDDYTRWGTFEELDEKNIKKMYSLIDSITSKKRKTKDEKKIINFWNSGMNMEKIEEDGINGINELINKILSIQTNDELSDLCGFLHNYDIHVFFSIFASQDSKDSDFVLPHIFVSGLNLSDRDYYLEEDNKQILDSYKKFIKDLLKKLDILDKKTVRLYSSKINAINSISDKIIEIEQDIAKAKLTKVEMRNPDKIYNKLKFTDLKKKNKNFNWDLYFSSANLPKKDIVIDQPDFTKHLDKIIKTYEFDILKIYILTRVIIDFLPFLSEEYDLLHFNLYGKVLSGQIERKERKKRMLSWLNSSLGEIIGKKYVSEYFPEKSKKKAKELVEDIINVFRDRLDNLEWMEESTKKKAIKKLDSMNVKIGYPDKWLDYSNLDITEDSFIQNILNSNKFEWDIELSRMNKEVDKDKWEMYPQEINAYYHPELNEIVFPAAILEFPFFSEKADDPINFGGIGAVIGHEITHGFDDQGKKYDYKGNLNEWWNENDNIKYTKRAKKIIKQFDDCKILDKNVNGELTQGENIADLGGLKIAYYALVNNLERKNKNITAEIDGFSMAQRFFISWAQVWRSNVREKEQLKRLINDPHSPNELRINEPLKNMPEFFEAFDIPLNSKMRRDEKDIIVIW